MIRPYPLIFAPRLIVVTLLFATCLPGSCRTSPQQVFGTRPDGTPVRALTSPASRVLVLFFVASDCPISNRTFPEMKRVREQYEPQGVAFWFVYPNRTERPADVAGHQQSFDPAGKAVLDSAGAITRLAGARVTPEAAILIHSPSGSWKPAYIGRIDDRYVRLGLERPQATQHFAERAITQALRGVPVDPATGSPIGCGIVSSPQ